jgi:hypothetical protein
MDVVYLEHDEYAHFDPITLTATVAAILLNGSSTALSTQYEMPAR